VKATFSAWSSKVEADEGLISRRSEMLEVRHAFSQVGSLGEGSGESTQTETIRNARIQSTHEFRCGALVIDLSPHKFRAADQMLPGRIVLNEDP
jgi:hypothetical protein